MRDAAEFSNLSPIQVENEPAVPQASFLELSRRTAGAIIIRRLTWPARKATGWKQNAWLTRLSPAAIIPTTRLNGCCYRGLCTGRNWDRAVELTGETARISGLMKPSLARLWQRIEEGTPPSSARDVAIGTVVNCWL